MRSIRRCIGANCFEGDERIANAKDCAEALIQITGGCEALSFTGKHLGDASMCRMAAEVVRMRKATYIDLSCNSLTNTACDYIADILEAKEVHLEVLDLSTNHISGSGTAAMREPLECHSHLRVLDLKQNVLGDDGARVLAAVLLINTHLVDLDLDSNGITDKGTAWLASAVKQNVTLERLNLGRNLIGDVGFEAIAQVVDENTTLKELWLLGMQASQKSVRRFASAVQSNVTLSKFAFSVQDMDALKAVKKSHAVRRAISEVVKGGETLNMKQFSLESGAVETLVQAIAQSPVLKEVNLESCTLPADGLDKIAEALKGKQGLQTVSLTGTTVSDTAAATLVEAFEKNPSLAEVDLGNCGMSERSSEGVAKFVQKSTALSKVNVAGNRVNDAAAERIADGIKSSPNLRDIRMRGGGGLTEEGVKKIAAAVEAAPQQVERLAITHVAVSDEAAEKLSRSIKTSANLTFLDLSHCSMGPEAGGTIADAVGQNQSVKKVSLAGNHLGAAGGEKLAAALVTHTGIEEINIEECEMRGETVMKVFDAAAAKGHVKKVAVAGNKLTRNDNKALKEREQKAKTSRAQLSFLVAEDKELEDLDRWFEDEMANPKASARGRSKQKNSEDKETRNSAPSSARRDSPNSARRDLPARTPLCSPREVPIERNEKDEAAVTVMDYDNVPESLDMPDDGEDSGNDGADEGDADYESDDAIIGEVEGVLFNLDASDVPDELVMPDDGDSDGEQRPGVDYSVVTQNIRRGDVKMHRPQASPRPSPRPRSSPRESRRDHLEYNEVPDVLMVAVEHDGIGIQDLDEIVLAESMEMQFEEVPDELPILDEVEASDDGHVTIRV